MKNKILKSLIQINMKKHVVCSYGYKLICVDDEFSKPFKSHYVKALLIILLY